MKRIVLFLVIACVMQLQISAAAAEEKKETAQGFDWSQIPEMTAEEKKTIDNFYRISGRVVKYHKRILKGKEVDWRVKIIKNPITGECEYPSLLEFDQSNRGRFITLFNQEKEYFQEYAKLDMDCEKNITENNMHACTEIVRIFWLNGIDRPIIIQNIEQFARSKEAQAAKE